MLVSSDAHNDPWELNCYTSRLLDIGAEEKKSVIFDGDTFNIIPLGYRKAWKNCQCIKDFKMKSKGFDIQYPIILVDGNHDPYKYLLKLFADDYPQIQVAHKVFYFGDIQIRHGHRWAVDWQIIRHIAPPIVEFMTDHFPNLWYKFSKLMGWIPSIKKEYASNRYQDTMSDRDYRKAVLGGWYGALGFIHRNKIRVMTGHTHCFSQLGRNLLSEKDEDKGMILADCGTLKEGKFYEVDFDIREDYFLGMKKEDNSVLYKISIRSIWDE